nr:hypothetical protein L204_05215 [Cryptococcus depauperatus CBS 7855]
MSMATPRPFAAPSYPVSPSPTTPSSLGYSQYGSQSFSGAPPNRQLSATSSAYGSASAPSRSGSGLKTSEKKGESREVARVHWKALKDFLKTWIERESPSARASAREKLTRLTKLQFQELSTDVYDELVRRIAAENGEEGITPFLPVREDFHPKRNQARQKLATLPSNRFKDLASDVFYELRRRFPDFDREEAQPIYEEPPAPGPRPSVSSHSRTQSTRSSPTPPPTSASRLMSSSTHQRQGSRNMSTSTHRSRPSTDKNGRQQQSEPEEEFLDDRGTSNKTRGNAMAATNDVVVPSKSKLREEDIEVPYARDSTVDMMRTSVVSRGESSGRDSSSYGITPSRDGDKSWNTVRPGSRSNPNSARSDSRQESGFDNRHTSLNEEREKNLRSEYDLRISGLDKRLNAAEQDRDEAKMAENQERTMRLERDEEVRVLKKQAATHASTIRALQHDLDLARDQTDAARQHIDQTNVSAEQDIAQWRERCEQLEDECRRLENEKAVLEDEVGRVHDGSQAVGDIRDELQSLVDEINVLSMRNDELVAEREHDAAHINQMEKKVSEYKRKYDAVRVELRNLKATSTMFATLVKPVTDDHLPASPDGNITDVNVSDFQSSIDNLLSAARSSAPSSVLPAMKAIVEAITSIGKDVKTFEAKPNLDVNISRLESLKYESTTRLNNLMQVARNHAMASGLSPVSLLDAAAGHLSANVVEIIKLLKIRRSNKDLKRISSHLNIIETVDRDRDAERVKETWETNYRSESRSESRTGERSQSRSESRAERRFESRGPEVVINQPTPEKQNARGTSRPASRNDVEHDSSRTSNPTELFTAKPDGSVPPSSYRSPSVASQPQSATNPVSTPVSVASPPTHSLPLIATPQSTGPQNSKPTNRRMDSFHSTSTSRSDSFELDRKSTLMTDRSPNTFVESKTPSRPIDGVRKDERESLGSTATASSNGPMTALGSAQSFNAVEVIQDDRDDDGREWEDLRPYLNAQSSLLVNSIQNLLASIRTNSSPSALNEHLSEVIAIASSIVAVSTNALPSSLRAQGDDLLRDLVTNTNKLSEAQEMGKQGGQQGFEKNLRQQIASASFGVAKSLKALMKLGGNE